MMGRWGRTSEEEEEDEAFYVTATIGQSLKRLI
jgi:hypothetical protein